MGHEVVALKSSISKGKETAFGLENIFVLDALKS